MSHLFRFLSFFLWLNMFSSMLFAAQEIPLLSQPELDPYGLNRVWFAQLKDHPAGGTIQGTLLEGGQLFIATSHSRLYAFDSESGEYLWHRSFDQKNLSLTEPAVNSRIVAIHNSLEVFLFNRKTGKQLLRIPLPSSAAAPCALSEHYLYIPMTDQTFLIYRLKEALTPSIVPEMEAVTPKSLASVEDDELKKIVQQFEDAKQLLRQAEPEKPAQDGLYLDDSHRIPITLPTSGLLRTKPVLLSQFYQWRFDEDEQPINEIDTLSHQEFLSWVTDEGFLYTAKLSLLSEDRMSMVYRIDSAGQTFFLNEQHTAQIDQPGSKILPKSPSLSQLYPVNQLDEKDILVPDVLISGGKASYVFAIDARNGDMRWRYPAQGQLLESIAVIGKDIYAPTSTGMLHALNFEGKERWYARNVKRFVAASKDRIYVLDMRDRLIGLDQASGNAVFSFNVQRFEHCLYNVETDQIFLITDGGLVQCLRESQSAARPPLRHRISSADFVNVVNGKEMPKLWWLNDAGNEESVIEESSEEAESQQGE